MPLLDRNWFKGMILLCLVIPGHQASGTQQALGVPPLLLVVMDNIERRFSSLTQVGPFIHCASLVSIPHLPEQLLLPFTV